MAQNPGAAEPPRIDQDYSAMAGMTRRRLLQRALALGLAGGALPPARSVAEGCVEDASQSLRASVNYVEPAPEPASACARCAFFTADPAGGACGSCQILSGPVDATAHCDSFSPPA
jgi:hypothetical protein